MTTTKANAKRGKKYVLAAAGGGKSTIAMLLSSTAAFKQVDLDLFDVEPANPTLRRYFKSMPAEHVLEDDRPEAVVPFLENRVFGDDRAAIVDLGANMEGHVLRWINDRGAAVAEDIRFVVPISKRDGITAAARIVMNCGAASVLLARRGSRSRRPGPTPATSRRHEGGPRPACVIGHRRPHNVTTAWYSLAPILAPSRPAASSQRA